MKATEQYFPVVLFIMLYKVVLSFASVDNIRSGQYLQLHFSNTCRCLRYTEWLCELDGSCLEANSTHGS